MNLAHHTIGYNYMSVCKEFFDNTKKEIGSNLEEKINWSLISTF